MREERFSLALYVEAVLLAHLPHSLTAIARFGIREYLVAIPKVNMAYRLSVLRALSMPTVMQSGSLRGGAESL